MESGSSSGQSDLCHAAPFSALRWERSVADRLLDWRTTSGTALERMSTFAEAICRTLRQDGRRYTVPEEIALNLKPVLTSCDFLTFNNAAEAIAYAGLHLLDRYGRVNQVLEYLIRIGRLPLRIRGLHALEVGAGPAPALYATRDFYASLSRWPDLGDVKVGRLATFDSLDRGRAWDRFIHHLSEHLMIIRSDAREDGALAFGRAIVEFERFGVAHRHHEGVAHMAAQIAKEFDEIDQPISDAIARQMAYDKGAPQPSAYDMIFLCNFLTQPSMSETFDLELRRLAFSLTPGGLMVVLGGTGPKYTKLHAAVKAIGDTARLRDVSPQDALEANANPEALALVAEHVRENVKWAVENCPAERRGAIVQALPKDLVDDALRFRLPKFRALVFVRTGPSSRQRRRDRHKRAGRGEKVPTE